MRWIVMADYAYEGLGTFWASGEANDPLPSFPTREAAEAFARKHNLISPAGRRNDAEILAVAVPDAS